MWVKSTAKFRGSIEDVVWDSMDEEQREEAYQIRKFRFNTEELTAYNESEKSGTTVRMKSGYELTIEMSVEELDKIIFTQ